MDIVKWVWLCGLVEGEGNFYLANGKYPQIGISSSDEDIIDRANELLNFNKTSWQPKYPGSKRMFALRKAGHKAVEIMMAMYPFLGRRRREAIRELVLPYLATRVI